MTALAHLLSRPVQDGPHETPEWVDEGIPFLSVDGIVDNRLSFDGCRHVSPEAHAEYSRKSKPRVGDVLLTKAASIGKVALVATDIEFNVWSPLAILRPDPALIDSRYLYFALQSAGAQDQLQTSSTKNTQQNVAMGDIGSLRIPTPSLRIQRAIADYLDRETARIDALIAAKRRMVELLEERFRRRVAEATRSGVGASRHLRDSGLAWVGAIPKHWRVVPNRATLALRRFVAGSDSESFTLLSLTQRGVIVRDTSENFGKFPASFDTYQIVRPNDLIFCLFDIPETPRTVGLSSQVGIVTGAYTVFEATGLALPEYLYWLYRGYDDEKLLSLFYTGLRNVIRTDTFLSIRMPLPPLEEQHAIVAALEDHAQSVLRLCAAQNAAITLLQERRQALITAAVTGELELAA